MTDSRRQRVLLLGSTGSIGRQALDVVRRHRDRFEIVGLAAGANSFLLNQQILEFSPRYVWCSDPRLINPDGEKLSVLTMAEMAASDDYDLAFVATVGSAGLRPSVIALSKGKNVALANKEVIVMAGQLLRDLGDKTGARMIPVDSEHNAIWQCLRGETDEWWDCANTSVRRLILTASGGAFRDWPVERLGEVTPEQATKHPNWQMGKKVTVDSATLMNKGFEVIEAHWLFGVPYNQIEVLLHRQQIVHSMVEFHDGSLKAQLGLPDMRHPIQYAMSYPERLPTSGEYLDLAKTGRLDFAAVPPGRYPCFELALQAAAAGGSVPAVLSAADDVAVELFLAGQIRFDQIHQLAQDVMWRHQPVEDFDLAGVEEIDRWARSEARQMALSVRA